VISRSPRGRARSSRRERRFPSFVFALLLAVCALVALVWAALAYFDRSAPAIEVSMPTEAIGRKTPLTVKASEPKHGVRSLRILILQGERTQVLHDEDSGARPFWKFWGHGGAPAEISKTVTLGPETVKGLTEGQATLRVEARNASWSGMGAGRETVQTLEKDVLLAPPRIELVSSNHIIRRGGSEAALWRPGPTAAESGVRVGASQFPGRPGPGGPEGLLFTFFAWPDDAPPGAAPVLYARDRAGNEATSSIPCQMIERRFREATIPLEPAFLERVVPEIQSHTPSLAPTGDRLKDFLAINGPLRRENAREIGELAEHSPSQLLWSGPFRQLGSSAVQAGFADRRSYTWNGAIVDRQTHLGYDLASVTQAPVGASNSGVVVLAKWHGIYGNTVILDHGFGLLSLYAHLSSISVEVGQKVQRGQTLGRTGMTGLAAGDHLHFSMYVDGASVDPTEWWDAHWIGDRIAAKLGLGSAPQ